MQNLVRKSGNLEEIDKKATNTFIDNIYESKSASLKRRTKGLFTLSDPATDPVTLAGKMRMQPKNIKVTHSQNR